MSDVLRSLREREGWRPGQAYILRYTDNQPDDTEIGLLGSMENGIDEKNMSVSGVLSTDIRSRDGDRLLSLGVDLSEFLPVPSATLNHNNNIPLGKAKNRNGESTLRVSNGIVDVETFFTQGNHACQQWFALVVDNVIRGLSIQAKPIWSLAIEDFDQNTKRFLGHTFPKSIMRGYSHVVNPDNLECLVRALEPTSRFDGGPLVPEIVRALQPFAPPKVPWSNGWTPEKTMPDKPADATRTVDQIKPSPAVKYNIGDLTDVTFEELETLRAMLPTDPAIKIKFRDKELTQLQIELIRKAEIKRGPPMEPAAQETASNSDTGGDDSDEGDEMKPGAQRCMECYHALRAAHEIHRSNAEAEEEWSPLREGFAKVADGLEGHRDAIRAMAEKHYPDVEFGFDEEETPEGQQDKEPKGKENETPAARSLKQGRLAFLKRFLRSCGLVRSRELAELKKLEPVFDTIQKQQKEILRNQRRMDSRRLV